MKKKIHPRVLTIGPAVGFVLGLLYLIAEANGWL